MATINQNAVAINPSANLADRNCNVVGLMLRGASSVSPWRFTPPSMPEKTDKTGRTASYRGTPGRVGRLARACLSGCAGLSTPAPSGLPGRAERKPRTAIGLSHAGHTHRQVQPIAVRESGN